MINCKTATWEQCSLFIPKEVNMKFNIKANVEIIEEPKRFDNGMIFEFMKMNNDYFNMRLIERMRARRELEKVIEQMQRLT